MPQRLHFVFGGELVDPERGKFRDPAAIDIIGAFPNCAVGSAAWKRKAQATVDNARARRVISRIHRLGAETVAAGPTDELG